MAKKTQQFDWKKFLTDRSRAVSSGILALILIILAFLALNTLSETSKSTNNKNDKKEEQTLSEKDKQKEEVGSKTEDTKTDTKQTSTNYTVVKGDSLWKIAVKFYNDGYSWTQIARENSITNPDKIESGQVLKISLAITSPAPNTNNSSSQQMIVTYTVHKGDSLWRISQKFYSGNGYNWVLIRNANPDKVGLLSNGRPRIEPNTVLTIPQLK